MLDGVDLSVAEDVERVRRSVAMLRPRSPALDREDALAVLGALVEQLRADP